jgi:DNA-binding GntR family transcriptional regulator
MADSIAEDDEGRHSVCNQEFHALVVAAARQPLLAQFVAATPYPLVISQYRDTQAQHPRANSLLEHRAIVAALRVRNSVAAEAVMRSHNIAVHRGLAITLSIISGVTRSSACYPAHGDMGWWE